ncbi:MAG: TetR/AcrR family transcriptional regulator [Nocardioidaceae bacterium]
MTKRTTLGRPSNRGRVLDAATAVAQRDGPGAVTIDAVVSESGMSRGGVLYHFRSKEALLQALVDQDIDTVREMTGLDGEAAPQSATERIRAYHASCVAWPADRGHVALAVALAENPALLQSWARLQRELDQADEAADGSTAMTSAVARLALDGLWFSDLIDPERFTPAERDRLVKTILTSVEESR